MQEEVLRLRNEVVGEADVKRLIQDYYEFKAIVVDVAGDTYEFADAEKQLASATSELTAEEKKLSAALLDAASHQEAAATAVLKTKGGLGNLNTAVQQAAYGIGDFASTSGGLGVKLMSVSNNVQFVTAQMGPWGAAFGLATVAIASLVENWDLLSRAFEEKHPFPKAGNDIAQMKRELDRAKEGMSELEKQSSLTASELEKYNTLRAKTAEIEKKVADEQERQNTLKKMNERKDSAEEDATKERAEALQDAIGGRQDAMAGGIAEAMQAAARRRVLEINQQIAHTTDPAERRRLQRESLLRANQASSADANMGNARDLLAQAMEKGDLGSFRQIQAYMRQSPDAFGGHFAAAINTASPEAFQEDRDFEAGNERAKDAGKRRREKAKESKEALAALEAADDKAARDALAKAKSDAPGLLESTASQIERGGDKVKAEANVRAMLEKAGLDKDEVNRATPQLIHEATGRAAKARIADEIHDTDPKVLAAKAETQRKKAEAEQKKKVDEQARLLEPANLKQQAEAVYMQARDQGATHRQASGQAQQFVNQSVRQLNPGLDDRTSQGVSQKIGGDASADLQRRSMALQARGLNTQGQAIEIMAQLNGEIGHMTQRLDAFGSQLAQIRRTSESRSKQNNGAGAR